MKNETEVGQVKEYQGSKLDSPIDYSFDVELFENIEELKNSEEWPSNSEILKMVNTKRKTAAKAAAYQTATKALKEAYENSSEFKRAQLVKAAVAAGFSVAEAEALAASKL